MLIIGRFNCQEGTESQNLRKSTVKNTPRVYLGGKKECKKSATVIYTCMWCTEKTVGDRLHSWVETGVCFG